MFPPKIIVEFSMVRENKKKVFYAYSDQLRSYGKGKSSIEAFEDLLNTTRDLMREYADIPYKKRYAPLKEELKRLRALKDMFERG